MSSVSLNKTVILAAGGTGGHIFPAESLAQMLLEHDYQPILITDKRYFKRADTPERLSVDIIRASSLGGNPLKKLKALILIILGTLQTIKLLKKYKPSVVVGFGGYPSLPTLCAAKLLKIPMVIHEQNAVIGRVNRLVAPWSKHIATSFENVSKIKDKDLSKMVFTGNPVRKAIQMLKDIPYTVPKECETLHLLVTGGSQGASQFSDLVPDAILSLPEALQQRIRIDQQCRKEDVTRVKKRYKDAHIQADIAPFFDDMPNRLANAHLVVARAGASTVTELTAAGKPSILIPYRYAMDDHQTANAMALEAKGATIVFPQALVSALDIAKALISFLEEPERLSQMAINALSEGVTDATDRLFKLVKTFDM